VAERVRTEAVGPGFPPFPEASRIVAASLAGTLGPLKCFGSIVSMTEPAEQIYHKQNHTNQAKTATESAATVATGTIAIIATAEQDKNDQYDQKQVHRILTNFREPGSERGGA
jgi:hypothetical protein